MVYMLDAQKNYKNWDTINIKKKAMTKSLS